MVFRPYRHPIGQYYPVHWGIAENFEVRFGIGMQVLMSSILSLTGDGMNELWPAGEGISGVEVVGVEIFAGGEAFVMGGLDAVMN
jgi:hypothetical protein